VSGQQTLTLSTEGVPAEFVAALVDSDGEEVDRQVFDRRHHAPMDFLETLEASVGRWIQEGEHVQLEFKRELSEKANLSFAETIAAFANGAGGVILIGVDDQGAAVGWRSRKPVDQITNIVADLVDEIPAIDVDEIVIDDKPIVVVRVLTSPAPRRPHLVRGRVMVRVNATTRAASAAQLRELAAGP
jgi:predicted HTH transcriptional regulator